MWVKESILHNHRDIDSPPGDPEALLRDFVSGGRCEEAFDALVRHYGGLVYTGALRRTGDPQLAEEVTQNVFVAIADKAGSLQHHPALTAWVFKTTRFESCKAMRGEYRRKKTQAALARETAPRQDGTTANAAPPPYPERDGPGWRVALPLLDQSLDDLPEADRQIVLQRFFEKRKFKDIAAQSGRSEAACKMRLGRALDKLERLLRKRGVALPAVGLAAALGTELTRAAPAQILATTAPTALAASVEAGALSNLSTTILYSMSTIKTASIAGGLVVAIACVPFILQRSETTRLKRDLAALESKRPGPAPGIRPAPEAAGAGAGRARPGRDLLEDKSTPTDFEILAYLMSGDEVDKIRLIARLKSLSPEEYDKLLERIEAYEETKRLRALVLLAEYAPGSPREPIDRLARAGARPSRYGRQVSLWAEDDPAGALAWFREMRAEDMIDAKGTGTSSIEKFLLCKVIEGVAASDPESAILLLDQNPGGENSKNLLTHIGWGLGTRIGKTGDDAPLRELLGRFDSPEDAAHLVRLMGAALAPAVGGYGNFDEGREFAERYISDPAMLKDIFVGMLQKSPTPFATGADWLVANVPPGYEAAAVSEHIRSFGPSSLDGASEWLAAQGGDVGDRGLEAVAGIYSADGDNQRALEHIEMIGDEAGRSRALDDLARSWVRQDPEQARKSLPAGLVDKYSPGASQ